MMLIFMVNLVSSCLKSTDLLDRGCIADYIPARPVPGTTTFYTNFCQAIGKRYFVNGKVRLYSTLSWSDEQLVSNEPWYHISRQNVAPNYHLSDSISVIPIDSSANSIRDIFSISEISMKVSRDDVAWHGGSSLVLSLNPQPQMRYIFKVFVMSHVISPSTVVTAKVLVQQGQDVSLGFYLKEEKTHRDIFLRASESKSLNDGWTEYSFTFQNEERVNVDTLGFYVESAGSLSLETTEIIIGAVSLYESPPTKDPPLRSHLTVQQAPDHIHLSWPCESPQDIYISEIYYNNRWIGSAFTSEFYLEVMSEGREDGYRVESFDENGELMCIFGK